MGVGTHRPCATAEPGENASQQISQLAVVFSKRLMRALANDTALAVLASDQSTQPFCMQRIQELVADLASPANLEAILSAAPGLPASSKPAVSGIVSSPPRQPSAMDEECASLRERVVSLDEALEAARSDLAAAQERLRQRERELSVRDRQNDGLRSDLARVSALLEAEQTGASPRRNALATQTEATRSSSTCSTAVGDDEPAPECQECASLRAAAAVADQRLTTLLSWVRKQQQLGTLGAAAASASAPNATAGSVKPLLSSSTHAKANKNAAAPQLLISQNKALFTEQIARLQAEEAAHRFKLHAECGLVCAAPSRPNSRTCPEPLVAALELARAINTTAAATTRPGHPAWQRQAQDHASHSHHAGIGESPKRPPGLPRSAGDQGSAVVRRLWEEVELEQHAEPDIAAL